MVTFEIQADELPGGQLVDDLVEFIERKMPKVIVKKDGSAILVTSEEGTFSNANYGFLLENFYILQVFAQLLRLYPQEAQHTVSYIRDTKLKKRKKRKN